MSLYFLARIPGKCFLSQFCLSCHGYAPAQANQEFNRLGGAKTIPQRGESVVCGIQDPVIADTVLQVGRSSGETVGTCQGSYLHVWNGKTGTATREHCFAVNRQTGAQYTAFTGDSGSAIIVESVPDGEFKIGGLLL